MAENTVDSPCLAPRFGYALNNGWSWAQIAVAFGVCSFGSAPLQSLALTYMLDAYNGKPQDGIRVAHSALAALGRVTDGASLRNHRRRPHRANLCAKPFQHDLRFCHPCLDCWRGNRQRLQHHRRHRHSDSILRRCLHLVREDDACEDRQGVQVLRGSTVRGAAEISDLTSRSRSAVRLVAAIGMRQCLNDVHSMAFH